MVKIVDINSDMNHMINRRVRLWAGLDFEILNVFLLTSTFLRAIINTILGSRWPLKMFFGYDGFFHFRVNPNALVISIF